MKIYGDSKSGNCLKVKWTADFLGRAYDWIETDIMQGESRTPAYLAMNPAGQVPTVIFADGRALSQSNAIAIWLRARHRYADPTSAPGCWVDVLGNTAAGHAVARFQ